MFMTLRWDVPMETWEQASSFSLQQDQDLILRGSGPCLHSWKFPFELSLCRVWTWSQTASSNQRDGEGCPMLCYRTSCICEQWMLFPCKDLDALIC